MFERCLVNCNASLQDRPVVASRLLKTWKVQIPSPAEARLIGTAEEADEKLLYRRVPPGEVSA